jgi:hypothetical protein
MERLTLEIPRPPFTPRPLSNHHSPAPAIPAAPVPVDQAPRAVCEATRDGYVVVICRKLSSPRPEESEARAIPKSRGGTVSENAIVCGISHVFYRCNDIAERQGRLTTIPSQLTVVQKATRRPYRIFPLDMSGQPTLASRAGKILKNATTPLGVSAPTRSRAAERIITYRTGWSAWPQSYRCRKPGRVKKSPGLTVIE